ncbi:flagellar filament capping protein FliD [Algicola sagamiensis]|uniref:flagellar filament capping protein FliD n=1 Tax=Algicola sagamiensis TaxID=163869 RepID=UPI00037EBD02|nr:flagellar filament capping protein FliD [Algicola sagamiensis]
MPQVTSAGVGSNLPLEDIIQATLNAERTPRENQLKTRKSLLSVELSGIGSVKSALSSLQTALKELNQISKFQQRTTNITQPSKGEVFTATATSNATPGTFDVEVTNLAQGTRAESAAFASGSSTVVTASGGTLTFTAGSKTFDVTLAAGATLADLREAINDKSDNFGVSANIINTSATDARLVYTSSETGSANNLVVTASTAELTAATVDATGSGAGGSMNIAAGEQAANANAVIDGIAVSSASNTLTDVIQDVTITLKDNTLKTDGSGTHENAKLEILTDKEKTKENINSFIEAYNTLKDTIDAVTGPAGGLGGDTSLRTLENQLFKTLSSTVPGAGNLETLYDVGVEIDNKGKLSLDSTKFDSAANDSFDDIGTIFADATNGVATQLLSFVDPYLGSGGIFTKREDSVNVELRAVQKDFDDLDFRMIKLEETLRQQYAALDSLVASLSSTSAGLTQALSSLPGFTNKS